jgi:hypothetical protein
MARCLQPCLKSLFAGAERELRHARKRPTG